MGRVATLVAAVTVVLTGWALPATAAIPIYGAESITTVATVPSIGTRSDSQTVPLDNRFGGRLEVDAVANVNNGDTAANTFGRTYATWATPEYGTVEFTRDIELNLPNALSDTSVSAGFDGFSGAPDWTYTFRAQKPGIFTFDYQVLAVGNPAGLMGWSIGWSGPGGGLDLRNQTDPTTAGIFSRAIEQGGTYTAILRNDANAALNSINERHSTLIGLFNWSVDEAFVPEPATWSLMIVGFAAVGVMFRRKRPSPAW